MALDTGTTDAGTCQSIPSSLRFASASLIRSFLVFGAGLLQMDRCTRDELPIIEKKKQKQYKARLKKTKKKS